MLKGNFLPEGSLIDTEENKRNTATIAALRLAMENNITIEGRVTLCDAAHNLVVKLGKFTGIVPRCDAAIGIDEGMVREIAVISRVGKPVAVKVVSVELLENGDLNLMLSRKAAQEESIDYLLHNLKAGDIIPARITHLESFGAFVDIGCGNISLIGIENISVSRIGHPRDRFFVGQEIFAAVLSVNREEKRIALTHRELLGTWQENAELFEMGQTVRGVVRGVEDYGVFVELAPNLSGLAEKKEGLFEGDEVSVFIKNIAYDRMKIKLIIIDVLNDICEDRYNINYFIKSGRIDVWRYSPDGCVKKNIYTDFKEMR